MAFIFSSAGTLLSKSAGRKNFLPRRGHAVCSVACHTYHGAPPLIHVATRGSKVATVQGAADSHESVKLVGFSKAVPTRQQFSKQQACKTRGLPRKLVIAAIVTGSSLLALGGFVAFMVLIQDRLVYKPSRSVRGSPQDFGFPLAYPTTVFTTDNVTLKGWFLPAPTDEVSDSSSHGNHPASSPATVLYFHGRDKNASFRLGKAKALVDKVRCNLLLLSYRGFGESAPNRFPTEPGMCRDAEAAMRHLAYLARKGQVDPSKIWVYGESLGGGVAVHIAEKYGPARVRGLILENTFTSLLDMIDRTSPAFSVFKPLSRNRWTNIDKVPALKMPILFLSGLRDAFIPPEMMKELYEKATSSSMTELAEFPDGTHNRTWMMEGYFDRIKQFIEQVGDRSRESPAVSASR